MLIGHHFGKRKPQWNFFIKTYENFKYSESAQLIKLLFVSFTLQTILFSPIVYWIFQNYALIESRLPNHLNLDENIQFEKKWIILLFLGISLLQGFWNYFVWKTFIKNERYEFQNPTPISVPTSSLDEADFQRRAS